MASFIRYGAIRAIKSDLISSIMGSKRLPMSSPMMRCINTSSKPPQASTVTTSPTITEKKTETDDEEWVSWGGSEESKWWDRFYIHSTMFFSITLCLVLGGTTLAYLPDPRLYEWSQREAYLQLRHREANGLPPIDRNLIDPAIIQLPTDEELGDTEIII